MPRNNDPFKPWNDPMLKNDPFAPWNGFDKDNPFKEWNKPFGETCKMDRRDRDYLRRSSSGRRYVRDCDCGGDDQY